MFVWFQSLFTMLVSLVNNISEMHSVVLNPRARLLAVRPWTSCLTSLCVSVFMWGIGIIMLMSQTCREDQMKWYNTWLIYYVNVSYYCYIFKGFHIYMSFNPHMQSQECSPFTPSFQEIKLAYPGLDSGGEARATSRLQTLPLHPLSLTLERTLRYLALPRFQSISSGFNLRRLLCSALHR